MRIDSSGVVRVGGTASYNSSDKLTLVGTGNTSLTIDATSSTSSSIFFADGADGTEAYRGYLQYNHASDSLFIGTSASEAMRIDSSGRLLIGTTSSQTLDNADCSLQVIGSNFSNSGFTQQRYVNSVSGPSLLFAKSRSGTIGTQTIVQNGDELGKIRFYGSDGNDFDNYAAEIKAIVDGTPGSNDMPGRLVFLTTADGAAAPTERMRISQNGDIAVNFDGSGSQTGVFQIADGSASSPGLTFWADGAKDTGIFRSGSNTLNFSTAGSERMRIDSSGNVGIGTSSPTSKLNVAGRLDVDGLQNQNTCEFFANQTSGQSFGILVNGGTTSGDYCANFRDKDAGNIMILRGNGNVGIGTSTPSVKLTVTSSNASGGDIVSFQNNVVNHYGGVVIMGGQNDRECRFNAAYGNGYMTFYPMPNSGAGSEHMRIRHGGVCMGRTTLTSFTAALHVSATAGGGIAIATHADTTCMFFNRTDSNAAYVAMRFYVQGSQSGFIQVNTSSVTYSTSSDYRLKENVVSISDGITRLKKLKPYRFNFKDDTSKTLDGFFAHEASEAVPEAVVGEKDAIKDGKIDPQGIDQSKLVPLLTAALQEAITKIETLETKVAALEAA